MSRFDINFTGPKLYFYPGETVAGILTVRVDEPMRIKKIILEFEGKSRVSWMTGQGKDSKFHWNSEEYFKHKDILFPGPTFLLEPEEGIHLNVGDHTYPFQYQLPKSLPPSFIAPISSGYVQYCMNVKLEDMEHGFLHHPDSQIHFKVLLAPVDLNKTPQLFEPRSETVEKFLCCFCCESGSIHIRAEIQKQALQGGEPLVFSFELDNRATNKPFRKVEARLMQRGTFYTSSREETQEFIISSKVLSKEIPLGSEAAWKDVRLAIPPDTVPNFKCKCMLVEYYFEVSVDIELAFDPKVIFPIRIVNGVRTIQPGLMEPESGLSKANTSVAYHPECLTQTPGLPPSTGQSSGHESQPANPLPPAYLPSPYSAHSPPLSLHNRPASILAITQQPPALENGDSI